MLEKSRLFLSASEQKNAVVFIGAKISVVFVSFIFFIYPIRTEEVCSLPIVGSKKIVKRKGFERFISVKLQL